jgi:hypothetical protein
MRKAKKSLKNRLQKVYGAFVDKEIPYAMAINDNADVLADLIDEVKFLRKRVDELEKADFSSNRSAEIEQIIDAEMQRWEAEG